MRISRISLSAFLGFALTASAAAQNQTQPQPLDPSQPPPPPATAIQPQPVPSRGWVPSGVAVLGQNASSRTEFTLDRSMLIMASKLDKNNEDLRRVIAGVNAVSVHSFRFPGEVSCDPATMDSISQDYRQAGWQHLLNKHTGDAGQMADLWVHMDQATIRDVAVLLVGARQLNFVSVSGSISPLDLLRLSGHFGIPKMDGGVVVPLPGR